MTNRDEKPRTKFERPNDMSTGSLNGITNLVRPTSKTTTPQQQNDGGQTEAKDVGSSDETGGDEPDQAKK